MHLELASPQVRGPTICDLRLLKSPPSAVARPQLAPNALVAMEIAGAAIVDAVVDAVVGYDA